MLEENKIVGLFDKKPISKTEEVSSKKECDEMLENIKGKFDTLIIIGVIGNDTSTEQLVPMVSKNITSQSLLWKLKILEKIIIP